MAIFLTRAAYYSFFISFLLCRTLCTSYVIDDKTCLDLSIETLSTCLDRTQTKSGSAYLRDCLHNPVADKQILIERQHELACFIHAPDRIKELKKIMSTVASHEQIMIAGSEKADTLTESIIAMLYFKSPLLKRYNRSYYALDASFAAHIGGLCLPLLEYLILHTSIGFLINMQHDHASCGGYHSEDDSGIFWYYIFQSAVLGCHIPSLMAMARTVKTSLSAIQQVKEKLIHVSAYLTASKKLYHLLKQIPTLSTNSSDTNLMVSGKILEGFFGKKTTCSAACLSFIENVTTYDTDTKSIFQDHIGKVLAIYAQYKEINHELAPLLAAHGQIDHYIALADIMLHQEEGAPWCFVEYNDSSKPYIELEQLRHMLLTNSTFRTWDIRAGSLLHRIITGDNGSGKSTYINGIGQALVLAQSIGIVPAKRCRVTPFNAVHTYRYIQDDIVAGKSRFYAECQRVEDILEAIEAIEQRPYFCCVLLDEPFTSTHADKGSFSIQHMLSRLFATTHSISFTATHYYETIALIDHYNNAEQVSFS